MEPLGVEQQSLKTRDLSILQPTPSVLNPQPYTAPGLNVKPVTLTRFLSSTLWPFLLYSFFIKKLHKRKKRKVSVFFTGHSGTLLRPPVLVLDPRPQNFEFSTPSVLNPFLKRRPLLGVYAI